MSSPVPVRMIFPELSCLTQLEATSPFLSEAYDADDEDDFSDDEPTTTHNLDNLEALDLATDVEIDVFAKNHYGYVTAMDDEELERYTKFLICAPSTRVYQRGLGDDDSSCTDTEHSDTEEPVAGKPATAKGQTKFNIKAHAASFDDLPTVPSTTPSEGFPLANTRFVIQGVQKELDKLVKLGKLELVQEIQGQHQNDHDEILETPKTPESPATPATPATPTTPGMTTSNSVSSMDSLLLTPTRSSTDLVFEPQSEPESELTGLGLGIIFEDPDAFLVLSTKNQNKVVRDTAPAPTRTTSTSTTLSEAWSTFELVNRPMPARESPDHWKPSMGLPKPKTTHSQIAGIFARGFHALRTHEDFKAATKTTSTTGSNATAMDNGMWHVPESARWAYKRNNTA